MIVNLLALCIPAVALIAGMSLVKANEQRRQRADLMAYRLSFPRELEKEAAARALAGFSGLLLPWWKRWLATPFVSLETHASATAIHHYMVVPEQWSQAVCNILQASVPAVRFEPVPVPEIKVRTAAEYRVNDHGRPLLIDAPGLSAKLLANLQPLDPKESIVIQWLVTPHGPVAPPKATTRHEGWLPLLDRLSR